MNRLNVQFLEFFRTGTFGPIALGMTKTQVESLLRKPQHWGGNLGCPHENMTNLNPAAYLYPPIWMYDAMEFHFGCSQNLFLIYCDHLDSLAPHGQVFDLNLWVFDTNREISKVQLMQALDKDGMSYQEKQDQYTGQIVLPSGVEFIYDLEGNGEIVTISKCDWQYGDWQ